MAFVRAGAGWLRVNTRGRPAHPGARPQASLRATCPTLAISGQVHSVVDPSPCKRKASLPPGGPRIFPWASLPRSSPAPTEAQCPGRTWGPEGVSAPGLGSAICVGSQGRRDPRPGKGSPGGHRLGPDWTAWGRALAQTVPTCTEVANLDRRASTLYNPVSYTHLTLPTKAERCRSRWSPYH